MVYSECRACGTYHKIEAANATPECLPALSSNVMRRATNGYKNQSLAKTDYRRWLAIYGHQPEYHIPAAT